MAKIDIEIDASLIIAAYNRGLEDAAELLVELPDLETDEDE